MDLNPGPLAKKASVLPTKRSPILYDMYVYMYIYIYVSIYAYMWHIYMYNIMYTETAYIIYKYAAEGLRPSISGHSLPWSSEKPLRDSLIFGTSLNPHGHD